MTDAQEPIKGKAPAIQWYVADWLNDPALKLCSLYARGLWAEMLMTMWQCEPAGHLAINGKPYTTAQLARGVREPEGKVKAALSELEDAGVFSKTPDGSIYSRRMVRDIHNRKVRAAGGSKGGNPHLTGKRKDNPKVNLPSNLTPVGEDNRKPTPSSSSSTSSSTGDKSPAPEAGAAESSLSDFERREMARVTAWSDALREEWLSWIRHLTARQRGNPSFEQLDKHRKLLAPLPDDATRCLWLDNAAKRGLREPCAPKKTEVKPKREKDYHAE